MGVWFVVENYFQIWTTDTETYLLFILVKAEPVKGNIGDWILVSKLNTETKSFSLNVGNCLIKNYIFFIKLSIYFCRKYKIKMTSCNSNFDILLGFCIILSIVSHCLTILSYSISSMSTSK